METSSRAVPRFPLLLLFFFLSGGCGLVYEVAWTRLLSFVLGNTTLAVAAVLTVFLGGLALGAWIAGRLADRWRASLVWYAVLEGGVGVLALLVPFAIRAASPLYGALYRAFEDAPGPLALSRFAVSGAILVLPCMLMGATLPVLSVVAVRDPARIGGGVGWLYTTNTLGAATGACLAGFVLLPGVGTRWSIVLAAAGNIALAAVTALLWASDRERWTAPPRVSGEETPAQEAPRTAGAFLLAAVALSGFATLLLEVAWTRTLSMVIGSSSYGFSILLTGCILGLGLGSALVTRFLDRMRNPLAVLAAASLGAGLFAYLVQRIFDDLPLGMVRLVLQFRDHVGWLLALEFLLVLLLLLAPTVLLGMVFPLVVRAGARGLSHLGGRVGGVYLFSTLGCISGSFLAGFVWIPVVGLQHTLHIGVLVSLGIGAAALWLVREVRPGIRWGTAVLWLLLAPLVLLFSKPWDREVLSSGAFLYAKLYGGQTLRQIRAGMHSYQLLYYREGLQCTVAVTRKGPEMGIKVDGKYDASNQNDMDTQELLGLVPALVHGSPERALVVGLASGVTAGALVRFPGLQGVECAEIEPAMVGASKFFRAWNGHVLEDPRFHLRIADARNVLTLGGRDYDLVVSEPSNPWMAGIATLFTREAFAAARARLRPGGVMGQWLHTYGLSAENVRLVARTFQDVFPAAAVFYAGTSSGDLLLIGRVPREGEEEVFRLDPDRVERLFDDPGVRAETSRIMTRTVDDLFGDFVMGPERLRDFAGPGPLHRDDRMTLEFTAPLQIYDPEGPRRTVEALIRHRESIAPFLAGSPGSGWEERADSAVRARGYVWLAYLRVLGGKAEEAQEMVRKGIGTGSLDRGPRWHLARGLSNGAADAIHSGDLERAMALLREAEIVAPEYPMTYREIATVHVRRGEPREAVAMYERYLEMIPWDLPVLEYLAEWYAEQGDESRAADYRVRAAESIGQDPPGTGGKE